MLQDWINELRATKGSWVGKQGGTLMREMFPPGYKEWLARFHEELEPKLYLEIGVQNGATLSLARDETLVFGVDPYPYCKPSPNKFIFKMTSDEFFEKVGLGGEVDLTFVDGMHRFEFALRDVLNAEQASAPGGTILVHDVLQISPETAGRDPIEGQWTGDVWKIIPVLKTMRSDLKLEVIECAPSGLLVITDLKPGGVDAGKVKAAYEDLVPGWIKVEPTAYYKPTDYIVPQPDVLGKP
jgi:hypothetical protein